MRFVFDTSVVVDYLRDDEISTNALIRATEIGEVFVSFLTLMELWLPDKTSFSIRDTQKVRNIALALDKHAIAEELVEELYENGFDFSDQPSFEVCTQGKKWQIEWGQERLNIRLDPNDILTIFPQQRNKDEILRDIHRVHRYRGIKIIPCSPRSQDWALQILEYHFPVLGQKREQNSLIDSMLIATGITRRAYLVTKEEKWKRIDQINRQQSLPFPPLKIISPEQLLQEF